MTNPFSPDVVAAVARHMNDDHAADSVLIVRAFGGVPAAVAVRMTGLDGDGMDFEVTSAPSAAGGREAASKAAPEAAGRTAAAVHAPAVVRVPWSRALTKRAEIRAEVTRMYHEAREKLGLPDVRDAAHS
ncbi:DUF2470 domain-containing protein [Longispora urticae]